MACRGSGVRVPSAPLEGPNADPDWYHLGGCTRTPRRGSDLGGCVQWSWPPTSSPHLPGCARPEGGTVGERVVGSAAQSGWGIGAVHGWRAEPLCNWSSATLLTCGFARWWGHVRGVAGAPATSGGCPHCQRVNSRSGSEGSVWMMMGRFIRRRSIPWPSSSTVKPCRA